jgi:hypothetical protein
MGGTQSSTIDQDVLNSIKQSATTTCAIDPQQKIDGNTIIVVGGSGNITLENKADLSGINCNLSASLNSQVTDELNALLQQQMTSVTFLIPDFTSKNQTMAIGQTVKSQIGQSSFASCQIGAQQEIDSNYIFAYNRVNDDVKLLNNGNVNNASCSVTNAIKQVLKNNLKATGKQTMTTISGLVLVAIAIIIIAAIGVVIFLKGKGGGGAPSNITLKSA